MFSYLRAGGVHGNGGMCAQCRAELGIQRVGPPLALADDTRTLLAGLRRAVGSAHVEARLGVVDRRAECRM